jgi:serine/threonine protein kinase
MPPTPTPSLAPNSPFGSYTIVRLLGKGTFGSVYEALRSPINKRVALKLLDPKLAHHPEAVVRFEREAYATASLEHANIVTVFEAGAVGDQRYLAMEYLDGETLDAVIARGPTPAAEIADTFLPLLSALAMVHGQGFIHRDLKPANIFLAQRAGGVEPKLLDFGVVKPDTAHGNAALTRKGAILGSPAYMSPEQAEARAIDTRSDLFSLSAVLWELATGRRLFTGRNVLEILHAVANAPVAAPSSVAPGVPPALDALVLKGLQRDVGVRFQSAPEMARALMAVASPAARARWEAEFGAVRAAEGEFHTQREMPAASRRDAVPSPVAPGDAEMEAATVPLGTAVGGSTVPMDVVLPQPPIQPAPAPAPAPSLPYTPAPAPARDPWVIALTVVVVGALLGLLAAKLLS